MEKIRVLQLFTVLNRGGAETNLMNYFRRIDITKFQFDFIVHREEKGAYEDEISKLGGKIYRLPAIHPLHLNKYKSAVKKFFDTHSNYDIIHGQCSELGIFIYKEAKKRKVPVIIAHAHNSKMYFDAKAIFRSFWKRSMMKYVNTYFSCGHQSSIWLFGEKKANEAFLMNNAIDTARFAYNNEISKAIRKQFNAHKTINIIHVGRFNIQKNHKFLIEIYAALVKLNPNKYKLFLVGEGELKKEMEQLVHKSGLNNSVVFLGLRSDVGALLNGMDIFLFPSLFEGFPVSLVEAQTNGLKCFVSEYIPEESILIKANVNIISIHEKPSFWAKQIGKYQSVNRAEAAALISSQGFDIAINVKKLENKYIQLLNSNK